MNANFNYFPHIQGTDIIDTWYFWHTITSWQQNKEYYFIYPQFQVKAKKLQMQPGLAEVPQHVPYDAIEVLEDKQFHAVMSGPKHMSRDKIIRH